MESLESLMGELADSVKRITKTQFSKLSDLSQEKAQRFKELWQGLGVKRRRQIIDQLASTAELNIELNFDRVFIACLSDSDEIIRAKAIEGLWECHEPGLIEIFISLLKDDPSEIVRVASAKALGLFVLMAEMGTIHSRYVEQLETTLLKIYNDKTQDFELRQQALESISYYSGAKILEIITEAYQNEEQKMKCSALRAMGRNLDSRWLKILLNELSSPHADLRLEAAKACGEMGDEKAVVKLIAMSEGDEDSQVQLSAIHALGLIGGRRAIKALTGMLKHPSHKVSIAAQEAQFLADPMSLAF